MIPAKSAWETYRFHAIRYGFNVNPWEAMGDLAAHAWSSFTKDIDKYVESVTKHLQEQITILRGEILRLKGKEVLLGLAEQEVENLTTENRELKKKLAAAPLPRIPYPSSRAGTYEHLEYTRHPITEEQIYTRRSFDTEVCFSSDDPEILREIDRAINSDTIAT